MPYKTYSTLFRGHNDWWYKDNMDDKRSYIQNKVSKPLVTECTHKETKYVLEPFTDVKTHLNDSYHVHLYVLTNN
jgi:hypothetical protein